MAEAPAAERSDRRARKAPRAVRRRQIIDATVDAISRVGFAETTLAEVARLCGMSQASLIFHFRTKDALLVETLRHLSDEYREAWCAALEAAPPDPLSRICALVAADFLPHLVQRKKVVAWHGLWAEAKSRPTYKRICGERDEERAEVMVEACAALLASLERPEGASKAQAADVASIIDSLCDGLWQRLLMEHRSFTRADGLRIMFLQLRMLFPERAGEIEEQAEQLWRKRSERGRSAMQSRLGIRAQP